VNARRGLRAVVLALLTVVVASACSAAPPEPLPRRDVAAPAAADPAQPCVREAAAAPAAPAPAPTGLDARYDAAANRLVLAAGTGVTLPALAGAVDDPAALREVAPGEWLLGADLVVQGGAELRIAAPDVRWLQLSSDAGRFVSLTALGGRLDVSGTCVTSWDTAQGRVDTEPGDGRSFLLARDGAQMTIENAELHHLGHGDVESYGLSWRTAGTGGAITDSIVSHLYYGLYTYEVDGLQVIGNEFRDNVLYGIDPHTGSTGLRIEGNTVHDNGKHGIILAEDCTDSVIRDNVVYRNRHHGIVMYQGSDRNLVEGNETFGNTAQGININESSDTTIRDNQVYDNGEAGVGVAQLSQDTVVEGNQVRGNGNDGVRVVSEAAGTTVRGNVLAENTRYGVYVDSTGAVDVTGNTVVGNRAGIVSRGASVGASEEANTVHDNREGDLLVD
jgi:parallel beta-helix repeat protein